MCRLNPRSDSLKTIGQTARPRLFIGEIWFKFTTCVTKKKLGNLDKHVRGSMVCVVYNPLRVRMRIKAQAFSF